VSESNSGAESRCHSIPEDVMPLNVNIRNVHGTLTKTAWFTTKSLRLWVATLIASEDHLCCILLSGSLLRCYTCPLPTISPLDCLKFPLPCGPAQKCLTSVMRGRRGAFELVIQNKNCGDSSMCGAHGTHSMLGTNFTYYTYCCSTDLCNGASGKFRAFWELLTLTSLALTPATLF
ncbi:Lymphocyte antigen 6G6e, partial [Varanus komodoensis]